jgi:glycosyltransferase involved in cell wall biosynthesis
MIVCYVALTEFAARKFVEGGLSTDKLVVKPNFVHPDPGVRHGLGEYAICVGRLSSEKGTDTLLQAWKQVKGPVPLLLVGDGPLREKVESQVKEDSRLKFCGLRPRAEVLAAVKGARFVVLPSRCYENFPMIIAEAYACGVPVIASDLGAMRELVVHRRTGLLFDSGNAKHLAESVDWAWRHSLELKHMGDQCRAEFDSKYGAERNYQSLTDIYARAISQSIA